MKHETKIADAVQTLRSLHPASLSGVQTLCGIKCNKQRKKLQDAKLEPMLFGGWIPGRQGSSTEGFDRNRMHH